MSMQQRSYSGELFRPRPEIHVEPDGQLVIVATPWGPRSSATRAIEIIRDYFHSIQNDDETTSPFSRLTCLSPLANNLRIAVKLANDAICHEENKAELTSGIELFVMVRNHSEISWVQVGYPYLLLDRAHRPLSPLGSQQDLAVEYSKHKLTYPPLPSRILGVDMSSDFSVESFRPIANDRLILVARSSVPASIYGAPMAERSLESLSTILSNDDPGLPFWLGILDLR
jgi:hypothetical protein